MRGILLLNLGSPVSKDKEDVKHFIGEMLSDPLVMDVPDWFRNVLSKKIIAPFRASRSAARYSLIWGEHTSSPLVYETKLLAKKIQEQSDLRVEVAMRYETPSIAEALERLEKHQPALREVVVMPMYPQYAQSSYQTAIDAVGDCFYKKPFTFKLKILEPFFDDAEYINALAISLKPYIEKQYDRLVFSFHSLPLNHEQRASRKGKQFDYIYQIKETIRLVTKELNIDPVKSRVVYSSAMGNNWLKPDLDETMATMPKEGIKKVITICPGFPTDNLETLYDVDIKARDLFMKNGGEEFHFVHGLNSEDYWAEAIIRMVTRTV